MSETLGIERSEGGGESLDATIGNVRLGWWGRHYALKFERWGCRLQLRVR